MTDGENKVEEPKVEEEKNIIEDDLFVDDSFIHYKEVRVQNNKNPKIVTTYKFGLKEITGFEEDKISKSAMKISGRTGTLELNQSEANIQFLLASVVEAPFTLNADNMKRLSKKIRDELLDFAREINAVTEDTEKK